MRGGNPLDRKIWGALNPKIHGDAMATNIDVEPYGGGFILADYSGKRGEASYCGSSLAWSKQPIVDDPFQSREKAEAKAKSEALR